MKPPDGFNKALRDRITAIIQRVVKNSYPTEQHWRKLGVILAEYDFENEFLSGSEIAELERLAKKARSFSKALGSLVEDLKFVVGHELSGVSESRENSPLSLLQDMVSRIAAMKPKSPRWIEERDIKLELNLSKWWKEVTGVDPTVWMERNADDLYSPYSEMMKEISKIFPRGRRPASSPASQRNRRKSFGDYEDRRAAVQNDRSQMANDLGKKLIEIRARLNSGSRTDRR